MKSLFVLIIIFYLFSCDLLKEEDSPVCCAPPAWLNIDKDTLKFNQVNDTAVLKVVYGVTSPMSAGDDPLDYLNILDTNIVEVYFTTEILNWDIFQIYHFRALNYGITKVIVTNLQNPSLVDSVFVIVDSNNAM